jgi:predicted phosphoadenosine phosphosulfate sulfurtransferase
MTADGAATPGRVFLDRSVMELAQERTRTVFDRYDHVAVSFSGGKDSTVVFNLAHEEAMRRGRTLDVVYFDEEAVHPPTVEYVERVMRRDGVRLRWLCWPIRHRNACSRSQPWWFPWAPEDETKWCRQMPSWADVSYPEEWRTNVDARKPFPEIQHLLFPPSLGRVAVLNGVRAQESIRRYRALTLRALDNWISVYPEKGGKHISLCKPIYDWKTEDVWTAPRTFGWDYNRTYDVFAAAGVKPHAQRANPPFGEEPLQSLHQWSICFPELWEKMVGRVAGVATAGRFARSPLYANGAMLSAPPDGMTWQQLIREALERWPPKERKQIATRISEEIALHNRATNGAPIPDIEPEDGSLSWQFLHKVAVRGDLKKRKTLWKTDKAQPVDYSKRRAMRQENPDAPEEEAEEGE